MSDEESGDSFDFRDLEALTEEERANLHTKMLRDSLVAWTENEEEGMEGREDAPPMGILLYPGRTNLLMYSSWGWGCRSTVEIYA